MMLYKILKLLIGKVTAASLGPHLAAAGVQTRPVAAAIEQKAAAFTGVKCLIGVEVRPDKTFEVTVLRQQVPTLLLQRFPSRVTNEKEYLSFILEVSEDLLRPNLLALLAYGRGLGSPFEKCIRGTAKSINLKIL